MPSLRYIPTHLSPVQSEIVSKGGFDGFFFRSFLAQSMGGAGGVVVGVPQGAASPVARHLSPVVYRALLEIALDCLTRPSDGPNAFAVETFGKLLVRPQLLRPIFRALPVADSWQTKHDVMKVGGQPKVCCIRVCIQSVLLSLSPLHSLHSQDMNVLLLRREENFPFVLEQVSAGLRWRLG
jgi:hypothetical protein